MHETRHYRRVRFILSSQFGLGDTYDRSVTIGARLSIMSGQQMPNQSINLCFIHYVRGISEQSAVFSR